MADEKFGNWLEGYLLELDDTANVSQGAGLGRARLKVGASGLLLSVNGSPYLPITTTGNAWVQGGNSFGAPGVLGTNDAQPVTVVTGGAEASRWTTAGQLLVGTTATTYSERIGVQSSFAGSGAAKAGAYIQSSVTSTDTGALVGTWITATSAINAPNTASTVQGALVQAQSVGTASVNLVGLQGFAGIGPGATGAVVNNCYGINAVVGFDGLAVSGTITNCFGLLVNRTGFGVGKTATTANGIRISNIGSAQITDAIGLDVVAQSGATGINLGIRTQSPIVVGTTNVAGTESLRVSGGGARIDGSSFTANVSGAVSIESTGAAINVGNNADAQAINLGTGASARTITVGNATAGTTLTLRAPTVNVAASTALQVNGSAGTAGQVLTSQGAGTPAIWAAAGSSSPLVLVSTTNVSSANTWTISGLNGDADGIYFLEAHLKVVGTAGDADLRARPNGSTALFTSVLGLTSGNVTVNQGATNYWYFNPTTFGGSPGGAQITINAWIQASSTVATNAFRTISGTSIIMDNNSPRSITAQLGGVWNVNSAGNNLTSIDFSFSNATTSATGPVSIYKLSRT